MKDVTYSSISELSTLLQTKQVSSVELAQHFLDRIEKYAHLNAFLDVRPEETFAQARAADERIANGTAGVLTGIPLAHKDIFVTKSGLLPPPARCWKAI